MIRATVPADSTEILAIAEAIGFQSEELQLLGNLLEDYWQAEGVGDRLWLVDETETVVGVTYCELERMADRVWTVQLIAIHPDCQGRGHGTALLSRVEQTMAERGGRMVVVETSASPEFAPARSFYGKCGYEREGCIRDFYATGDDKVIFRKLLQSNHS